MLELDGIGFAYTRDRWLFRGVSHRLRPGEVVAILGPNGRGKTTLLRCAVGLATPGEGQIRGHRDAGFVPQSYATVFAYRAIDMVLMGRARHLHPFAGPGRRDEALAWAAMARVGVADLADRVFSTLSGGERALVLIARAVAAEGRTLVLDEPAAALDLRNQGRILRLLRQLANEGLAILMTTHHPDHALEIADTVLLMTGTDEVRIGPTQDLLTDEAVGLLYGVRARTVTYDDDGTTRRVFATRYEPPPDDRGAQCRSTPDSPAPSDRGPAIPSNAP